MKGRDLGIGIREQEEPKARGKKEIPCGNDRQEDNDGDSDLRSE